MSSQPTRETFWWQAGMPQHGLALVEVLAALVLFAIAGAIVASAATTNVRSMRAAAMRGRLVALAAREMARQQVLVVPGTRTESFRDAAGHSNITGNFAGTITRETTIDDEGTLATLTVTVATAPPGPHVRLTTRAYLSW